MHKLEYSSEHAQLQNSKGSSQIECSICFLHQRAISKYIYIYIYGKDLMKNILLFSQKYKGYSAKGHKQRNKGVLGLFISTEEHSVTKLRLTMDARENSCK